MHRHWQQVNNCLVATIVANGNFGAISPACDADNGLTTAWQRPGNSLATTQQPPSNDRCGDDLVLASAK